MATLLFSIETVGQEWDSLSIQTKDALLKSFKNSQRVFLSEDESLDAIKANLPLFAFTGKIVSIAMYDLERELGAVYFYSDIETENFKSNSSLFKARSESEMLEDFWEGAKGYDTFVTFNGYSFTLPYLHHRSAILQIKPTVEIAKQKFITKQTIPYHIDLMNEFTFYGAMQRRPSLALLAGTFGLDFNNDEDTAELFLKKKFRQIAEKNEAKVLVMRDLYEIWKQYYAPLSFLNTLD